ncbi:hypothetical protein RHMOL_Rhmol01G0343800 [Rhododendron molle]|nr:hypothetical protein RHMOL_Rhmol01G0343800 [Rhododendron molle]
MMTVGGFWASPPPSTTYSRIPSITRKNPCPNPSWVPSAVTPPRLSIENNPFSSSSLKVRPTRFGGVLSNTICFRCNSSTGPGAPGPGEGDSRSVLDAFFLGKALAEAVNERVESAVGEFFSALGRLQAEQQKQVQDFQEDVLERAKRAKEKAAHEAMEAQSLTSKPSTAEVSVVSEVDTTTNSSSVTVAVTSAISPPSSSSSTPDVETKEDTNPTENDPLEGVSFHCLVQPVTLCSTLEMRFLEIFRISR